MRERFLSLAACAALAIAAPFAHAGDYVQSAGSSLQFAGSYQGEGFSGRFPGFTTTLRFDPAQLATSRLDVTIPITSATTGNEEYDDEMLGTSFFDTKRFPQAHYTATKFRALGGNRFAADGTLTLHGVTKPVTLAFTWTPGAKPVLAGKATVKRLAFNVGGGEWNDTSLIPDDVVVTTKVVFAPK
jgi:polyisoprenoid-binding protein YceI